MSQVPSRDVAVFDRYRLDARNLLLTRDGMEVEMPPRSLALLRRLVQEPGVVISKQELLDSVWSGVHLSPTSLAEAISRLRQALDDDASEPRYVQTVRGRGYRFVGSIQVASTGWASRRLALGIAAALGVALAVVVAGGLVVSRPSAPAAATLARLSPTGELAQTLSLPPLAIVDIAVAPDGRRTALAVESADGFDIWVFDPAVESLVRITRGGSNLEMVWSPDGEWLVYSTDAGGSFDIARKRADGLGQAEVLLAHPEDLFPESFASDGLSLIYSHTTPDSGLDLAILSRESGDVWSSRPLRSTRAHEYLAALSPRHDSLAFVSNESGRWEAYVQRLDSGSEPMRISRGGVRDVFWSADGEAIHVVEEGRLVRIPLGTEGLPDPQSGTSFAVSHRARVEPTLDGGYIAALF